MSINSSVISSVNTHYSTDFLVNSSQYLLSTNVSQCFLSRLVAQRDVVFLGPCRESSDFPGLTSAVAPFLDGVTIELRSDMVSICICVGDDS
jgi:hypothetical protein